MKAYESDQWLIERLTVGELMVNCYLIACKVTHEMAVVDPGDEADRIMRKIREMGGHVKLIVNTHGHGDHIGGNESLAKMTGAPIAVGRLDAPMLPDAWLNLSAPFGMDVTSPPPSIILGEGDVIEIGKGKLTVLDTPGHTPGGITLVDDGFAFVGDLIFNNSVGRTDFPGGDSRTLLKMINEMILTLDDDVLLLPGHGDATTVGEERRENPYINGAFDLG